MSGVWGSGGAPLMVGREAEMASLSRVLDAHGPRVCFVHGIAGIGKSTLLSSFALLCESRGIAVVAVDCREIDPTEAGFRWELERSGYEDGDDDAVVLVDSYEFFRIADPWMRRELLPSLPSSVRVVVAGREAPMLEWSVERGRLGGLEVLSLGPLGRDDVAELLTATGIDDPEAVRSITQVACGHPLALRLALESETAAVAAQDASPRIVETLATAFRAGLDGTARQVLDAASVPRRVTRGLLAAMLDHDPDDALETLGSMAFVEATSDGLRLHDAVQAAIAGRLRSIDPERFRSLRAAAWRHLQDELPSVGHPELHRSTADLLFLIDNPVVREAMFPTTAHTFSVEPSRPADAPALEELWYRHDTVEGANVLDAWFRLRPQAVRAIRDRAGTVVGCSVVAEWRDIPSSLDRADPVVAAWSRHAAVHPLPPGQRTLTHRRVLAADTGEGPSGIQAAAWLDLKSDYFRLRPHLGRLYTGIRDPTPFLSALVTLGFQPFEQPVLLGGEPFHLASLDFGTESIDGWLSRLAADELGIAHCPFLDRNDRTVDVDGERVKLSPLEFGVIEALAARRGAAVSRVDLIEQVWGTTFAGGSNTVDATIRGLRKKLGRAAGRVEAVRGVGYRLN